MTEDQLIELQGRQKAVGDAGEEFVLRYERKRLGRHLRVGDVRIVGRRDVGLGYDVLSFLGEASTEPDLHIEVKTYSCEPHFFLSQGEWAAANKYGTNYAVYLVDVNKINISGYEPTIIHDPARTLKAEGSKADDVSECGSRAGTVSVVNTINGAGNIGGHWQETVQQREFRFVDDNAQALAEDFEGSTVLLGCYNSERHFRWIKRCRAYNVRQGYINGAVVGDEVARSVKYLLLYDCGAPRNYTMHMIDKCRIVTRNDMLKWGYPNPHARSYMLYHLQKQVTAPALDIMQVLRTFNDKVTRTSGTPIYLQGKELMRYLLGGTPLGYTSSQTRVYTNEGKPWTKDASMKLSALYLTGTDIAALAHTFKRTAAEIRTKLTEMGLIHSTTP